MKIDSILFVCLGNICRSPVVAAVARARFARAGLAVRVDSAGTSDWHAGGRADPRSVASASARGYDVSAHRARQVVTGDFTSHDKLLVMDRANLRDLAQMAPDEGRARIAMFLPWTGVAPEHTDLPDPYYGQSRDFERVIDLAEQGVDALIGMLSKAPAENP